MATDIIARGMAANAKKSVTELDNKIESEKWIGTKAEWEAVDKSTIKDGTIVYITDDKTVILYDKAEMEKIAAQVAEDRTATETAAQTAQAVADSLPEDYTTAVEKIAENTAEINNTNTEVSELKKDLSQFTNPVGSDFNVDDFIIGGRASYGNPPISSETRVTNKITGMSFLSNMTITPKDNSVKHFIYRQDNTNTGWITTPFIMESGKKYDYVCAYADDRTITDIAELLSHFTIISDLTSKVLEIDETIEFVKKISSEYKDKTISILGDSISTFGGDGGDDRISDGTWTYRGNRCRYPQSNLLTDVNDTYWKRIIDTLGLRLGINESWAGSRVSNTASSDSGDVGPNRHIASATRIGHLGENGTPDIILVNAGTNDIGASVTVGTFNTENPMNYTDEEIASLPIATFADAYRTMLIRLQKMYPTAKIICLLPNYTTSYYTPTQADVYCEVIKEACDFFGIKWKDMRASGITMFNRGAYLPDGIHYNSNGMEMIAKNILKELRYDFTM